MDRWADGEALMRSDDPEAWSRVVQGYKLVTANEEAVSACWEAAKKPDQD